MIQKILWTSLGVFSAAAFGQNKTTAGTHGKIVFQGVADKAIDPITDEYCSSQKVEDLRDALLKARKESVETGTTFKAEALAKNFPSLARAIRVTEIKEATFILNYSTLKLDVVFKNGQRGLLTVENGTSARFEDFTGTDAHGQNQYKLHCLVSLKAVTTGVPPSWIEVGAKDTLRDYKKAAKSLIIEPAPKK